MPKNADHNFYERANAHINLANDQLQQNLHGKVSASMMYATARFNTSLTAGGYQTRDQMLAHRTENIDYFVREFRLALEEHMDEYVKNFEPYRQLAKKVN